MPVFVAWVYETAPCQGYVAYDIKAATHDEAVTLAIREHGPFAQVDREPVDASAA